MIIHGEIVYDSRLLCVSGCCERESEDKDQKSLITSVARGREGGVKEEEEERKEARQQLAPCVTGFTCHLFASCTLASSSLPLQQLR